MSETLVVNNIDDKIKLEIKFNFLNQKLSNILKSALEVDPEYSKEIKREFEIDESGNLNLSYQTHALNIKPMKKSVNAMYENMRLILETIQLFNDK